MINQKDLLIVERSSGSLAVSGETKDYVLEGIFGEIDSKNKNNRIYTEAEYLPQIESLQKKIKSSKLLGELDHPQQFDVSLKNVSHVVEELYYDKNSKQVRGRIRLLDTDAGRQAKALVDAGVPLQISSRAAGTVESNGKVKIKQLFTYDLVADPGFENAELSRVNESYGFSNDDNLFIYEINSTETKSNEIKPSENMEEFVNTNDFNKYTQYLAEQIKSIKDTVEGMKSDSEASEKFAALEEMVNNVVAHNDHIVENVNNLAGYSSYLAEKLDQNIQYTEYVAENTDNTIQYAEHVAEKVDQSIQYSEHLAEKLDQSIQYAEHLAESVNKVKEYSNYLAESQNEGLEEVSNIVEYTAYLKESLESVAEYAEYIAESINESLVVEEVEDEGASQEKEDANPEAVGDNSKEGSVEGEDAGEEAEDLDSELKKDDAEVEDETKSGTATAPTTDGEDAAHDPLESYKNDISAKLGALTEKAQARENESPSFFRVVSKETQSKYNELNEDAKTEVRKHVSARGFMTESQIVSLIESSQLIVENRSAQPFVLEAMPEEYKEKWEALSEAKQNQILAQSKYHKLSTEYQVRNFWQTRDMREESKNMEKIAMVNESKTQEEKPMYDVSSYAEQFKKRFKK